MAVTLTAPVEGKDRGDTYSGPNEDWLVANGYAARASGTDALHVSDVPASKDPTLAANREPAPAAGPDAYRHEDGAKVLAFDTVKAVEVTFPEGYVPPLAHPHKHGTTDLSGVEVEEDKLSAKLRRNGAKALPDDSEVAYEAVPQGEVPITLAEAAKEGEKVIATSEKVREKADSDIPESKANVVK